MHKRWLPIGALLIACTGLSTSQPPGATHIPPLRGTALSGEKIQLPEALQGKVGILVSGFSQASRGEVTAWARRIAADYRDAPGVVYFELPMMASVPRLLRGFVIRKIAEDIPDRAKARCLPVFDHEPEWRTLNGFAKPDDAYVLVVDGSGTVQYHAQGQATDGAYAEVKKRVESLR